MRNTLSFASMGLAVLLALPVTVGAAPLRSRAPRNATGTIVYVGPAGFAIDTGTGVEAFSIPGGAPWAGVLAPGGRVEVTWRWASHEAGRTVVSVEALPVRASRTPPPLEIHGRVAYVGPGVLAVETSSGVELLDLAKGAPRPAVVPGDDVDVWFRIGAHGGQHVVSRIELVDRHEPAAARRGRH